MKQGISSLVIHREDGSSGCHTTLNQGPERESRGRRGALHSLTRTPQKHEHHPIMVTLPLLAAWFRIPSSARVQSVFPADRDIGDRKMSDCVSMAITAASRTPTEPGRLSRNSRTHGVTDLRCTIFIGHAKSSVWQTVMLRDCNHSDG